MNIIFYYHFFVYLSLNKNVYINIFLNKQTKNCIINVQGIIVIFMHTYLDI